MKIIIINIHSLAEATRSKPLELSNYKLIIHAGDVLVFEAQDTPEKEKEEENKDENRN